MILAAGLGMRMRPLTERMPKPLVPVAGRPLIDYALEFMVSGGVENVVVNASYLGDMLETYLSGKKAPESIRISREDAPLETGGGIAKALPLLGDAPFICYNSDIICLNGAQHAIARLSQAWDDTRMDALLLLQPRDNTVGFEGPGDFFVDESGCLERRGARESAPYVFSGVQLLHPRLFAHRPQQEAFSMNVLYNYGMEKGGFLSPRIGALVHDGDWLHVGDLPGLEQAEAYFGD